MLITALPFTTKITGLTTAHIIFILTPSQEAPFGDVLNTKLKRCQLSHDDLKKTPISADIENGQKKVVWVVVDDTKDTFAQQALLRMAIQLLLDEHPHEIALWMSAEKPAVLQEALYIACLNGQKLNNYKNSKISYLDLEKIVVISTIELEPRVKEEINITAEANTLARQLILTSANDLTPKTYRDRLLALAKEQGWQIDLFDLERLRALGAGAFVAVAQGSDDETATIVRIDYIPEQIQQTVSLVGKGICFDTGGYNLKPAKYMNGMNEDMAGSATVLAILYAATKLQLPIKVTAWLAIAQNHIGPKAYKPNDVVKALNGKTIEIIHTDAEGRMVLADTLTLASRENPDILIDIATLTGSMGVALGDRYSGILGNCPNVLSELVQIGNEVGERVCIFPSSEDYHEDLKSDTADIKQCTLEGEADHILAVRFLSEFVEGNCNWVHIDLSAHRKKGGLGAVGSDVNGFGVRLLTNYLQKSCGNSI